MTTPGSPSSGREARRTERLVVHEGVVVQLDGTPAMLVDLSPVGAQVLSPTVLRPGQPVQVSMADERTGLRFAAIVVWVSYEVSHGKGITGYRAGVNFLNPDHEGVAAFCARNRKTAPTPEPNDRQQTTTPGADGFSLGKLPSANTRGARRAKRLTVPEGVVVQLDGNPAMLVDLSPVGAQVLSPTALRPSQSVQMSMVDEETRLQFRASVVWVSYELSGGKGITGYRAGVNFLDADREGVEAFCARNRRTTDISKPFRRPRWTPEPAEAVHRPPEADPPAAQTRPAQRESVTTGRALRDLPKGTPVVIMSRKEEKVVFLVKVKRKRFLAEDSDGRTVDVSVDRFVRVHRQGSPRNVQ